MTDTATEHPSHVNIHINAVLCPCSLVDDDNGVEEQIMKEDLLGSLYLQVDQKHHHLMIIFITLVLIFVALFGL